LEAAHLPELPHFLVVEAKSTAAEEQVEWVGLVESKVRLLATLLEKEKVADVRVWPKAFPSSSCCRWLIGFRVPRNVRIDLNCSVKSFTDMVTKGGIQARIWKKGMVVKVEHRKRRDLSDIIEGNILPF